jgi:hypothetical protein
MERFSVQIEKNLIIIWRFNLILTFNVNKITAKEIVNGSIV